METKAPFRERRLHSRHRSKTRVRVKGGTVNKMVRAINMSAGGCLCNTGDLGLAKGQVITLDFAIDLGTVVKIHHRMARVAHITNGCTGFEFYAFEQIRR